MQVTAWTNSRSGYGLKIKRENLNEFDRNWGTVKLNLYVNDEIIKAEANIDKESFWTACRELINKDIKKWLEKKNLLSWEKGNPPTFEMRHIKNNIFEIRD